MSKSLYQKLSLAYKTSRFPWKKHALIGYDLKGNEYWDCPNPLGGRMKRWVQMVDDSENDLTVFHENKLPVQWQAWLRHTRTVAPTIQELVQEERRKALVQERAKALDQEWEQRKLELQKIQDDEQREVDPEKEQKDKEEAAKSSRPSGTGDTFSPGEWNPTSSRRR
ncbi:hypothetical protein HMPREF1544_05180 [Mucor circinelloides 1006PhL]|uniref:NADH dehydrogenase [ubiquinone] 1 alpha subcomplex subunit n=1 Tax=Mucor circinelloides f. circinelloides (strain 1006PhL) TaxID=1220926 RepID=S2JHK8_MUCC1|nr:hypothetical protein HMPREF1544_05180 [Mucor circinelloides 1006PhL]